MITRLEFASLYKRVIGVRNLNEARVGISCKRLDVITLILFSVKVNNAAAYGEALT